MSDETQKELIIEPCPFCGEAPRRCHGDKYVQCETENCAMSHSLTLLAEWNSRPKKKKTAALTETMLIMGDFMKWLERNPYYIKLKALQHTDTDLAGMLAIQSVFYQTNNRNRIGAADGYATMGHQLAAQHREIQRLEQELRQLEDKYNPPF